MVRLRLAAAFSLAVAALAGPLVAPAQTAQATTDQIVAPSQIGYDVSFPQCEEQNGVRGPRLKQPLPVEPAFGIVGVNGGLGNTNNACFAAELQWALQSTAVTSQPRVGLYVNAQNPGHEGKWWPTGDATQVGTVVDNPFGSCVADDGPACSYVYGYSMAEADVNPAVRHVLLPAAYTWWLDVETSNTWSSSTSANRAVLEGMVAAFSDVDAHVGLYSTHLQWSAIVGRVPVSSPLAELPSWLSAAVTQRGAAENCTHAPLTGGRVSMAQWSDGALDYNISCRQFSVARIPTLTGAARVGARLTAHAGAWAPGGITLRYHWLRNGRAMSGATGSSYLLRRTDAGARISVQVIGTKLAYNAASRTSSAVQVARVLTSARPTITGTARAGRTLTAHAGRWAPAPVSLTYRWLRDGVVIPGATRSHHRVVAKDVGHRISLDVTGTKRGYTTVRRTSSARSIPRTTATAGAPAVQPSSAGLPATPSPVHPSSVAPSLRTPPATPTNPAAPPTTASAATLAPPPPATAAGSVASVPTASPAITLPAPSSIPTATAPALVLTPGGGILLARLRAH